MSTTIPFLEGHQTFLRGLTEEDLDGPMSQWSNDREVTRMLYRGAYPETRASAEAAMAAVAANPKEIELAIVSDESGETTGRSVEMEELTSPGHGKLSSASWLAGPLTNPGPGKKKNAQTARE